MINTRQIFDGVRKPALPPHQGLSRQSVCIDSVRLDFSTPTKLAKWRVDTLLSKEPETIAWMNCFQPSDLFLDVGANVGMYSVYAAAISKTNVFAFEPESQNFSLLNENIFINNLESRVRAYPIAVSNERGLGILNLSEWGAAGSCHSAADAVSFSGESFQPKFRQGAIQMTLDDLFPSLIQYERVHLKIDVDGIEPKIVEGGVNLLASGLVRSVLIEVNQNMQTHRDMVERMLGWGFIYDPEQVAYSARKSGPFKGVANHVFVLR